MWPQSTAEISFVLFCENRRKMATTFTAANFLFSRVSISDSKGHNALPLSLLIRCFNDRSQSRCFNGLTCTLLETTPACGCPTGRHADCGTLSRSVGRVGHVRNIPVFPEMKGIPKSRKKSNLPTREATQLCGKESREHPTTQEIRLKDDASCKIPSYNLPSGQ